MRHTKSLLVSAALAAIGMLSIPGGGDAQAAPQIGPGPIDILPVQPKKSVYAVKFLCGRYDGGGNAGAFHEGPVKPGNYQTAINIHNPSSFPVAFIKKAVLMFDSRNPPTAHEVPMRPGNRHEAKLESDWGMEIDCPDIREVLLNMPAPGAEPFIKGWVVLETSVKWPLDVTAAYTAHGFSLPDAAGTINPEGFSLEVVPVTPKEVF